MAKKTISPFEQHFEKGVLGLAAVLVVGSVVYFLLLGVPYRVQSWDGESVTPGDLGARLADAAQRTVQRWQALGKPPAAKDSDAPKANPSAIPVAPTLPRLGVWPPVVIIDESKGAKYERPLAKIVAPSRPVLTAHRNVLMLPDPVALDQAVKSGLSNALTPVGKPDGRPWVICGATIDLEAQSAEFRRCSYPRDAQDLTIYDFEVQRRLVTKTAGGGSVAGAWEAVPLWRPVILPDPPATAFGEDGAASRADIEKLDKLWTVLKQGEKWVLRPALPETEPNVGDRSVRDPVVPYLRVDAKPEEFWPGKRGSRRGQPAVAAMAKEWVKQAQKILQSQPPDLDYAYVLTESAYWAGPVVDAERDKMAKVLDDIDQRVKSAGGQAHSRSSLRRYVPLACYDMSVKGGSRYQYRMRLITLNRFAGRPNQLARAEDAKTVFVSGEWSPPSDEIEAPSDTYAFLTRVDDKDEATVHVFKQIGRELHEEKFVVTVGDPIGEERKKGSRRIDYRLGSIVVDIIRDYSYRPPGSNDPPVQTIALICTDPDSPNKLRELVLARDQSDPKYGELQGKVK